MHLHYLALEMYKEFKIICKYFRFLFILMLVFKHKFAKFNYSRFFLKTQPKAAFTLFPIFFILIYLNMENNFAKHFPTLSAWDCCQVDFC